MHVACFVKTFIFTLSKEIDQKKINCCFYPTKTQMFATCFVKKLIVILSNEIDKNK